MSVEVRSDLENLPIGHKYYTQDESGAVHIARIRHREELPLSAVVALALTQACCERGEGQVLTFLPSSIFLPAHSTTTKQFLTDIITKALPELIYVARFWSVAEQIEFRSLPPIQQLHLIQARYGRVQDHVQVLPMAVAWEACSDGLLRFNGVTQAPYLLAFQPTPFVGLTTEFVTHCKRTHRVTDDGRFTRCSWQSKDKDWTAFQTLQVHGLEGVLDKLEWLLAEADQNTMMYKQLMMWAIEEHRKAKRFAKGLVDFQGRRLVMDVAVSAHANPSSRSGNDSSGEHKSDGTLASSGNVDKNSRVHFNSSRPSSRSGDIRNHRNHRNFCSNGQNAGNSTRNSESSNDNDSACSQNTGNSTRNVGSNSSNQADADNCNTSNSVGDNVNNLSTHSQLPNDSHANHGDAVTPNISNSQPHSINDRDGNDRPSNVSLEIDAHSTTSHGPRNTHREHLRSIGMILNDILAGGTDRETLRRVDRMRAISIGMRLFEEEYDVDDRD